MPSASPDWVKEVARTPVIVKLTPNITDIRHARACRPKRAGADALSAINTINSITSIDLDTLSNPAPWSMARARTAATAAPP